MRIRRKQPEPEPPTLSALLDDPDPQPDAVHAWLAQLSEAAGPARAAAAMLELQQEVDRLFADPSPEALPRLLRLRQLAMPALMGTSGFTSHTFSLLLRQLDHAAGPLGTPTQIYNYRGCALAEVEEYEGAVAHFTASVDADPAFVPAYCNRARALLLLDRPDEALADVAVVRERDPDYPQGRFTCRLIEILVGLAKHRPPPFWLIASEHGLLDYLRTYDRPLRPGEPPDFAHWDEEVIQSPPEPAPDAGHEEWNHYGFVNARLGAYDAAEHAFEQALRADPTYERSAANLARTYQVRGEHERAIEAVTPLIDGEDPAGSLSLRARSWRALGRVNEAREDDRRAAELRGMEAEAYRPPDLPSISDFLELIAWPSGEAPAWDPAEVEVALYAVDRLRGRGRHGEALARLAALARRPAGTPELTARVLLAEARTLEALGRQDDAAERYAQAVEIAEPAALDASLAAALEGRARAGPSSPTARADLERALRLALRLGDVAAESRLRVALGAVAAARERRHEAISWYASALDAANAVEDWAGAGELLARLAELTADDPEDPARAPAYRAERERLLREAGELAWLGGSARARSAVVEASREALLAARPAPPLTTDATFEVASELLGVANDLRRKHERYADSLPYYHAALVVSLQLRDPSGLSAALVGLGGSYNRLAGQAARAGLLELDSRRDELGDHSQLRRATAAAISTGRAWELTELALASRVWVLEEAKARGDLVAQANQISNLAETEERLGNLETAARYQRWAERVHSEAGDFEAAAIDARELVGYAKHLGDDEDLARWERRRGELGAMAEAARD